jgi:DNA repair exonuclease SbcCD nuclease subunit
MKIGHCSDLHIDISATRLGKLRLKDGKNEVYLNRLSILDHIINTFIQEKVDMIVLSGDIFDKPKPFPQEYYDVDQILKKVKDKVYLMNGNHDEFTQKGCGLQPFESMGYKVALEKTTFDKLVYFNPWGLPIKKEEKKHLEGKILVLHAGVKTASAKWVEVEGEDGNYHLHDLAYLNCMAILLGHHHSQIELSHGIWYAGSPEVYNFGEEKDTKGFLIWDITNSGLNKVIQFSTKGLYPDYKTFTCAEFLNYDDKGIDAYIRIKDEVTEVERQDILKKIKNFDCLDYQLDLNIRQQHKKVIKLSGSSDEEILKNYLKSKSIENISSILKTHHEFN